MPYVAWLGLNAADLLLTGTAFLLGARELNPFLGTIAIALSTERMFLIKLLLAVALGGALWQRRAFTTMRLLNWAMIGVVVYNALIITYALS
ncbi:MAG: hypothetical protein HY532_03820 [Chloroflexi bacterium]|nr:hypothetical protein [Chloroflexota bacterium]